MSEYAPGTVALVTFDNASAARRANGGHNIVTRVGVRSDGGWGFGYLSSLSDEQVADPALSVEIHPLVVLDLPSGAKAGWHVVLRALREAQEKTGYTLTFGGLADQIEAQTRPPKPAEPQGLGAVVEASCRCDDSPKLFHRDPSAWHVADKDWQARCGSHDWDRLTVVRVIWEGER